MPKGTSQKKKRRMEKGYSGYGEEKEQQGGVFGNKITGKRWLSLEIWYWQILQVLTYEIVLLEHNGKGLFSTLVNRSVKWRPDYEASMLW